MHALLIIRIRTSMIALGMIISFVLASPLVGQQTNEQKQREQIGEVLGKPVYRDEIRTGKNVHISGEVHRLFSTPVMQKYRQSHKAEIEPTENEISAATAFFDKKHRERIKGKETELRAQLKEIEEKLVDATLTDEELKKLKQKQRFLKSQLKPPGRQFAIFMLRNWKFQRHLYDKYDGGRILWQQAGLEAFDAMHKWLKIREKNGNFIISDSQLRLVFYEYWTTHNHGAFLTDDKVRIRREFLEPEWKQKSLQN